MIRRLQPGYRSIGAVHAKEDKEKIRFCSRCQDMFGVQARLGPRIRMMGTDGKIEPPQPGDDMYLTCRNCGSTYEKHLTKPEPLVEPIVQPQSSPSGKPHIQGIEKKKKTRGRGNNPRLRNSRYEISDEDLKRELKDGAQLVSYYSSDPIV